VVTLIRLADHRVVRVLSDNAKLREKLTQLEQPVCEFFRVEIGDGLQLDAWGLKPPGLDPARKIPLMLHVYGEPHGQTVRDAWQGSRGLWHWMLAQQGYLVASVDNRGTMSPRGRAWRKCVYRQIGIIAPEEQAAATRALLQRWSFADPQRVGIWGWSGGGSMSLNALFRYPDLYHTAIAVAPNADQLLYDTIYQERYMGLPADNAENYRLGSPITHASQLKGNLLLVHGTGDDNGHFQGTEKLMNELIAHNKRFTVMPYPARSHAINEGRNTVPHFYSLMTDYLHEHLPVQTPE
jgi:dipeptidyl-peptidase-4